MDRAPDPPRPLTRTLLVAAGLLVLGWFLYQAMEVLLLFTFVVTFALILNAPTTWLEQHRVPRVAAALLVCGGVLLVLGLLGWLIVPHLADQVGALVDNLPRYAEQLANRMAFFFGENSALERKLRLNTENLARLVPGLPALLGRIGHYSLSLFEAVVVIVVMLSMVLFIVAKPRPLLRLYLLAFPPRLRDPAAQALTRSSVMVVGWMWSNVIVGSLEAVAAFFFLSFMDIPGALVWASLTLFAELLPKIGAYVMATPPTLVALSVSPLTGLWVALFYVVLNELTGSLLMPRVRASTMDLHPVSTLFMMLAMGSAFGLAGALVATPVAAYLKAYFEVFYLSRFPRDPQLDARVEAILHRRERG